METVKKIFKAIFKPKNMSADELSDTSYIISLIALLLSFVAFLLSTR